jgi:uncharacterized protein (DUF1501 family)
MNNDRRRFIGHAGALTGAALARRLVPAALAGLAAQASAQSAPSDYRALVCVFLFGGVDGNSLLVPLDAGGYGQYSSVRTTASGVNLAQSELLPIQPSGSATPYGLHPELSELQPLFASGTARDRGQCRSPHRSDDQGQLRFRASRQSLFPFRPAGAMAIGRRDGGEPDGLGRAGSRTSSRAPMPPPDSRS